MDDAEAEHDSVDVIVEQWRQERPDLDVSYMEVFGRMARLLREIEPTVEQTFARHGLRHGEFDVLTALRRSGAPYILTPSVLAESLMMSRAGMTNRLDRLVAAGLIRRDLDPGDRRSFRVALTEEGRRVVDAALSENAGRMAELMSVLDPEDREVVVRSLRTLLRSQSR